MWYSQRNLFSIATILVLLTAVTGCAQKQNASPASGTNQAADGESTSPGEVTDALAQLSEADRTAAIAQKVCPVSNKPLGSMGKPPKVALEGQDVFLCCVGCEDTLKSDPAKYLAKLRAE